MNEYQHRKREILGSLRAEIGPKVNKISKYSSTPNVKAKMVNEIISECRASLLTSVNYLSKNEREIESLIIQYCCSVVSLEYRNQVFPYEYMAFSRRVGELWECFCKTAWDYPVNDSVCRIQPPNFINVKSMIIDRIRSNLGNNPSSNDVMSDVNKLCDVIGNINMKEDEVFRKDDIPHVIDFKSGFGSNEKGNMLRLLAVGKAYKIWDSRTQLMLLIRQNDNNHYLNSLRNSRIWDVHTGLDSYKKIKEITGSDIENVLKIINWESDFSNNFYEFLVRYNLTKYLDW